MSAPPPVRITAVGAVKHALTRLMRAPHLPASTIDYFTAGGARDHVLGGAPADLVLTSEPMLDALAAAGRIVLSRLSVGRTGLGFAVPKGAPPLATDTRARLADTLNAAPSIAMADPASGATAGKHFQAVLDELGLGPVLAARTTRHANGMLAVAEVAAGRAAIGVSQVTEIVPTDGVDLGGTLPDDLQMWTGYGAALTPTSDDRARVWFDHLASPAARQVFAATGFVA